MKTVILILIISALYSFGILWFPILTFWLIVAAFIVVAYAFIDSADIPDEEMKL